MSIRKIIRIFCVIVILLIIIPVIAEGESALDYYSKGNECLANMNFEEAIKYFNRAIDINPKYIEAYTGKGMALYKLGELGKAGKCFNRVIELNPSEKNGWYGKGLVYLKEKKYEEAIQNFDKALKIDGGFKKAREGKQEAINGISGQYISKADELFSRKKYEEAIEYYDKALEITPADEYSLNKKEEAKKSLTLQQVTQIPTVYIAKTTPTPKVSNNLYTPTPISEITDDKIAELLKKANNCYDRKEYDKAIAYYDAILALSPSNVEAITKKAKAELLSEQKTSTTPAQSPTPKKPDVSELIKKANIYYDNGKYDKAIGLYEAVIAIDPDNKEAIGKKAAAEALIKQSSITPTPKIVINALTPTPQATSSKKKSYVETVNGISFEMVYIQGGTFEMASPSVPNYKYTTTVKSFYIGKYEVTNREYSLISPRAYIHHGTWSDPDYPVENVLYDEALEYCMKLTDKTGKRYNLPTETEWYYACCAGTTTKYYWGDEMDDNYCWYKANSDAHPHPVGQTKPNAWGLYDMMGNVWEWCNGSALKNGYMRPVYGGGYDNVDFYSYNPGYTEKGKEADIGFRIVMRP